MWGALAITDHLAADARKARRSADDSDSPALIEAATRHYHRLLNAISRRAASRDEAADIVQDAYARLAAAASRTPVRDTGAFLYATALNLLRDRARAAAVRRDSEADLGLAASLNAAPSAERALIGRQQLAVLEQALAELPPKRRAALVLYRFDGLSHAAIAERLGLSVSMVEKHVRCALDHCRRRLEEADDGDR